MPITGRMNPKSFLDLISIAITGLNYTIELSEFSAIAIIIYGHWLAL